jgi:glycosyltransferase involved in cell wall biosynthesis
MKKICLISPSLKVGGIQRELVVLANYFVNNNHTVYFLTCFKSNSFYELDEKVEHIDCSFRRGSNEGGLSKIKYYSILIKKLRKTVKSLKPDTVLTYGDIMGPLVLAALYNLKYPVYIGDKTSHDYKFKFPIPLLKKVLYPTSAGYIAQTTKAADYRKKEFGSKLNITVIPNGIREVKLFPDEVRENIILYVGRFAWEKSPDRLIKAFSLIKDTDWKLVMAGDGPLLNTMKTLAKVLNIEKRIEFLGQVKDVDQLFAKASLYVMPSFLEGFPNALCEAMASGLCCTCYSSIPYEDIFEDGKSGFAIKDDTPESLAKKIIYLIAEPEIRQNVGMEAMKIRERLTVEKAANAVFDKIFDTKII